MARPRTEINAKDVKVSEMQSKAVYVLDTSGYQANEFVIIQKWRSTFQLIFLNFRPDFNQGDEFFKDKKAGLTPNELLTKYHSFLKDDTTLRFTKKALKVVQLECLDKLDAKHAVENLDLEELYVYAVELYTEFMTTENKIPEEAGKIEVYGEGEAPEFNPEDDN